MPRPRLSPGERTRRRREAALRGAATARARREAETAPPVGDPDAPTARSLIDRSQAIGREEDLYYHAHLSRYGFRPSQWTVAQRQDLARFLAGFIRPDGSVEPVPHRRRKHR
jgi:hypothetical protein